MRTFWPKVSGYQPPNTPEIELGARKSFWLPLSTKHCEAMRSWRGGWGVRSLDGEIRAVKYDDEDHASLCFDGKRMVVTAQSGNTTEYRLFPDEQIKVIGHFDSAAASHFEAFFPDGRRVRYGVTDATRPMAQTGVPRAWLVEEQSDPRMWIPSAARNSVAARPRMIPLDTRVPSPIACFPVLAVRSPWLEAT
jgi:hypothetical protein